MAMPKAANSGNNRKRGRTTLPAALEAHKFKPGVSGNPSGRPKSKPITEIYEELLNDPAVRASIKEACRKRLLSERMVGGLELKEAAERVEGKVTQPIEAEVTVNLADAIAAARKRAGK